MNTKYIEALRPNVQFRASSIGLIIIFCVMYQVYFYGMSETGVFAGPFWQRLVLKLVGLTIFYLSIFNSLSVRALLSNFVLKLPLIFIAMVTMLASPFLGPYELQALNLCFFIPLLAFDFNKIEGTYFFNNIFKILSIILVVQVILDPVLKVITGIGYANSALIGGVGNANSFGYLLLCSAIYCLVCLKNKTAFYFLCLASLFTGSLLILILSATIVFFNLLDNIRNLRFSGLAFIVILVSTVSAIVVIFYPDYVGKIYTGLNHSMGKFESLLSYVEGNQATSVSISLREEYTLEGLRLVMENPLSLLVGHPNGIAMYTGDGWWLGLLVTHGLLVVLLFFICNIFVFLRGFRLKSSEGRFAAYLIALTCVVFLSNRILDYWPAAIVYVFAFAYACNSKIKIVK